MNSLAKGRSTSSCPFQGSDLQDDEGQSCGISKTDASMLSAQGPRLTGMPTE
jgi:hypothetical protein